MCISQFPDRLPFVYIIRDTSNNKRYAGVKFSKGCKPTDLLTKYFTSSKTVKRLIKEGRTFVIDKIVEFETKEDAVEFEELLILTVNAHLSGDWYNLAAGKAINPDAVKQTCLDRYDVDNWMKTKAAKESGLGFKLGNTYGYFERSEDTKVKMSKSFTGRVFSKEHRKKISESRTGICASDETKVKMSDAHKGVPRPASFSEKMSVLMKGENNPMYGKVSHRKGIKDEQIQCENCGKFVNKGNYNRWHGSNCKHINDHHLILNTPAEEVNTNDSIDPYSQGFV